MKHIRFHNILLLILLIGGVLTLALSFQPKPPRSSYVSHIALTGEYRLGQEAWKTLPENLRTAEGLNGALTFRGHFPRSVPAGSHLYFISDHISIELAVNGRVVFSDSAETSGQLFDRDEHCGRYWAHWITAAQYEPEDLLEIRLKNHHIAGNPNCYDLFFRNIYSGSYPAFLRLLDEWSQLPIIIGIAVILISSILLGVSLISLTVHFAPGIQQWKWAAACICLGLYMLLDTPITALQDNPTTFLTTLWLFCKVFGIFFLHLCIAQNLTTKFQKFASALMLCSQAVIAAVVFLPLVGVISAYDTQIFWCPWQIFISFCFLFFCVYEWRRGTTPHYLLAGWLLLLAALLMDLSNFSSRWVLRSTPTKICFLVLFTVRFLWVVRYVPTTYKAAAKARELEAELVQSQFDVAMSQIQPHFLYNALGSIYHLCGKNPRQAQQAVGDFSDYLRMNLGSLRRRTPIPFETELQHIKTYLALEKMSSDDELDYAFHIEATNFSLPALSVQPLVENAVKHGIFRKEGGGTVTISSREFPDHYAVIVADDGVGFDPARQPRDGEPHIGISNVRHRLATMCGGRLHLESAPGAGTTATVILPKGEQNYGNSGTGR